MEDFYEEQGQQKAFENVIVNNIECELKVAVQNAKAMLAADNKYPGNDISWLDKMGATVSLKLTVDEKSGLNPGVTLTNLYQNGITRFPTGGNVTTPQSFALGLGASGSLDATRIETLAFTYSFADLLKHPRTTPCGQENGVMIESNLKIGQFLIDKVFLAEVPGTVVIDEKNGKVAASPFSVFSYQVTFVASYGGSVTPTWKFVKTSVNPNSPFLSASRSRTQDLTITIGPTKKATTKSPAALVSNEAVAVHEAALIGQAVATAIQSQQR